MVRQTLRLDEHQAPTAPDSIGRRNVPSRLSTGQRCVSFTLSLTYLVDFFYRTSFYILCGVCVFCADIFSVIIIIIIIIGLWVLWFEFHVAVSAILVPDVLLPKCLTFFYLLRKYYYITKVAGTVPVASPGPFGRGTPWSRCICGSCTSG